jgi:hypothetical protein
VKAVKALKLEGYGRPAEIEVKPAEEVKSVDEGPKKNLFRKSRK